MQESRRKGLRNDRAKFFRAALYSSLVNNDSMLFVYARAIRSRIRHRQRVVGGCEKEEPIHPFSISSRRLGGTLVVVLDLHVFWAFSSVAKEIARRTVDRNKRLGRDLIESTPRDSIRARPKVKKVASYTHFG